MLFPNWIVRVGANFKLGVAVYSKGETRLDRLEIPPSPPCAFALQIYYSSSMDLTHYTWPMVTSGSKMSWRISDARERVVPEIALG
jgi:hypothetical protein